MISIIIPAYNEEKGIRAVVDNVKKLKEKKEVIVVDDGSTDRTFEFVKNIGVKVFKHESNLGKGIALKTALDRANEDILVTIDADCSYPVDAISSLVKPIAEGRADVVVGSRFLGKNFEMGYFRFIGNKLISFIVSILTRRKITDVTSGMRAFTREVWENIEINSKNLSWEAEFTVKAMKKYRVVEVPINYMRRIGKSKLTLLEGIKNFWVVMKCL